MVSAMRARAAASMKWRTTLQSLLLRRPSKKRPARPMGVQSNDAFSAEDFFARLAACCGPEVAPAMVSVVVAVLPFGVTVVGLKATVALEVGVSMAGKDIELSWLRTCVDGTRQSTVPPLS